MLAVYFACCICNPLMVVAFLSFFFFTLFYFLTNVPVGKVGRKRKWSRGKFLGMARSA